VAKDHSITGADQQPPPDGAKHEDAGLAHAYQQAAAGDAYRERKSGGPVSGGRDPTLTVTPEVPGVPMKDVAKPDPLSGEMKGVTSDARAPGASEAILSGLEPGETSAE
jgi:hypothetical protein